MTAPGTKPKQFTCVDLSREGRTFCLGGSFYESAFKELLQHGYLDEGSRWLQKSTGIIHEVIGMRAPPWLPDNMQWKQETDPPIGD